MNTKTILLTAAVFVAFFFFPPQWGGSGWGFAQDTASAAQKQLLNPVGQMSNGVKYFKVEIGMHILDCPVLPPCLKTKLMALNGIKEYKVDWISQSIQFNLPEGVITKEQIAAMAAGCGFPAKSVNVIVDTKPFSN